MADLRHEIIELIEARGRVGTADFERLRMAHSASPIEIAGEIDRVLGSDARLAAKHRLAEEVTKRARAREAASLSWLDDYRDRAVALGWSRDDLAMLLSAETQGRHPSRDTMGDEPESQGVSESHRDADNASPLSSRQQSDNPGEPGQAGEDGDGRSRSPEAPGHRADDDEFQIKTIIAGIAITVLLCVIVVAVLFGNESPRVNPAE